MPSYTWAALLIKKEDLMICNHSLSKEGQRYWSWRIPKTNYLSLNTKITIFNATVSSVLLYGVEAQSITTVVTKMVKTKYLTQNYYDSRNHVGPFALIHIVWLIFKYMVNKSTLIIKHLIMNQNTTDTYKQPSTKLSYVHWPETKINVHYKRYIFKKSC